MGPVSRDQLSELAALGRINSDTLVWRPGFPGWSPYRSVLETATSQPATGSEYRFCSQCGQSYAASDLLAIGQALVCANCKDSYVQRLRESVPAQPSTAQCAGFWIRFVAALIDGVILWILQALFTIPLSFGMVLTSANQAAASIAFIILIYAISISIACTYEAYFVANKGGTPGKLALSLQVIRSDGARPSWRLAVGRYFAKIVSSLPLLIGFVMAAFDEEKRALHDRICDTRVVRKV